MRALYYGRNIDHQGTLPSSSLPQTLHRYHASPRHQVLANVSSQPSRNTL
ncbi:hypothetical protein C8R43DRAFT_1239513 [Mycena crocata]|nr:hypothetical protein C8R43DRAFT_1239513 [Mycena crocata]